MTRENRKIIVIVGPTASGKSDFAKALVDKYNGEAISADSRQIYRYMNIGTGKDKTFFQHMIDIKDPNEDYSVAEYQSEAYKIINDILSNNKVPIIVGGTGLYVNSLIYGYEFPKTDQKLRLKIEKMNKDELYKKLVKYDPVSAEKNKENHRRLARALESYTYNSRPLSKYKKRKPNFTYLMLGIDIPRKELYKKIDRRVDERINQGMIEEVEKLLQMGINYDRLHRFGLEYRYIGDYLFELKTQKSKLKTKISKPDQIKLKEEMIQKLKYRIHDYARRQLTWFRKNKEIIWIKSKNDVKNVLVEFLQND